MKMPGLTHMQRLAKQHNILPLEQPLKAADIQIGIIPTGKEHVAVCFVSTPDFFWIEVNGWSSPICAHYIHTHTQWHYDILLLKLESYVPRSEEALVSYSSLRDCHRQRKQPKLT